jgi:hypothetical protein
MSWTSEKTLFAVPETRPLELSAPPTLVINGALVAEYDARQVGRSPVLCSSFFLWFVFFGFVPFPFHSMALHAVGEGLEEVWRCPQAPEL